MIIENIPYIHMDDVISCSMSACLSMLLRYHGIDEVPQAISESFGRTFMSEEFHSWNMNAIDMERYEASEMMACAQYLVNMRYAGLIADIMPTDMAKVKLSYIKRGIPIVVTGKFPLLSGKVSNSVLIRGYVDDYFIVNDPRGNARTGYRDRYGENMVYRRDDLVRWISSDKAYLLRILRAPMRRRQAFQKQPAVLSQTG